MFKFTDVLYISLRHFTMLRKLNRTFELTNMDIIRVHPSGIKKISYELTGMHARRFIKRFMVYVYSI